MNNNLRNRLHIQLKFDPKSDYMAKRKNGPLWLKKAFSNPLNKHAGASGWELGDVYAKWACDYRFIIMTAEVNAESYKLFSEDYDAFMQTIYGEMDLNKFGVLELIVSDYAEIERKAEERVQENILDYY